MHKRMLWAITVLTLLAACSTGGSGALDALRDRHGAAGGARVYDSLDDLLGNTRYRFGTATSLPATPLRGSD